MFTNLLLLNNRFKEELHILQEEIRSLKETKEIQEKM